MADRSFWLFKTEPSTYSFETLLKEGTTNWNGVRNYQARNFLREVQVGDTVLIYHSGDDKSVVGEAKVRKAGYPDLDADGGDWVQIDLEKPKALNRKVPLAELKSEPRLKSLLLIRQSRLSCMPVTAAEFKTIGELAAQEPKPTVKKTVMKAVKKKSAKK